MTTNSLITHGATAPDKRSELTTALYSSLQLMYQQQLTEGARLAAITRSPSEMVSRHEELHTLLEAQRARSLQLGALCLELMVECGGVSEALSSLMSEVGLSFAELLGLSELEEDEPELMEPELSTPMSAEEERPEQRAEALKATPAPSPTKIEPLSQIVRVIELPKQNLASQDEINQLSFGGSGEPFGDQTDSVSSWGRGSSSQQSVDRIVQVFEELGEMERPAEVFGTLRFTEEFAVIQRFCDPNYISCWSTYGRKLQRVMCEHLAARLRYLQELSFDCRPMNAKGEKAFESLFGRLTDLIAQKSCGWVHGLKRDHKAKGSDWLADAKSSYDELRALWDKQRGHETSSYNPDQELDALRVLTFGEGTDEAILDQLDLIMNQKLLRSDDARLCGALIDHEELLKSSPSYKQLRTNIRKLKVANEEELLSLEQDYLHLAQRFQGQRVKIIGGDPRQHVLQRVRSYLPESDIEWIELREHGGVRKIENLCQSIARGGLDVLLIVQDFISHKVTIKLKEQVLLHKSCQSEMVTSGYGVTRMLYALEQIHSRLDTQEPYEEEAKSGGVELA